MKIETFIKDKTIENRIRLIYRILFIICVAVFVIFVSFKLHNRHVRMRSINLSDNAVIKVNDKIINSKVLSVEKGDIVTVTLKIPKSDIYNPVIYTYCPCAKLEMFHNKEVLFTYGDYSDRAIITGRNYVKIPIYDELIEEEVMLKFKMCDSEDTYELDNIELMNTQICDKKFIAMNLILAIVALSLFVVGILSILFIMLCLGVKKRHHKIMVISAVAVDLSIWILNCYRIASIVIKNEKVIYYAEFISLFIMVILINLYLRISYTRKSDKKIIDKVLIASIVYTCVATILQALEICYFSKILIILHLLMFITCIMVFIMPVRDNNYKKKSKILYYTIGALYLTAILTYMIMNLIGGDFRRYSLVMVTYLEAICITVYYVYYTIIFISEFITSEQEKNLKKLAFKDGLTSINNRRACIMIIDEIDRDKDTDYCLIIFDINGLKMVNDTFGHASGDDLIKDFAYALRDVFTGEDNFYGRFGGDEFLAVLNTGDKSVVEKKLEHLQDYVDGLNDDEKQYEVKFSYGYYIKKAGEKKNAWDALSIADNNMYQQKKEKKEKNKK